MMRKDKLSYEEFERLVEKALATLPKEFQSYLENVVVVIEDESPDDSPDIVGLYEGVPVLSCLKVCQYFRRGLFPQTSTPSGC